MADDVQKPPHHPLICYRGQIISQSFYHGRLNQILLSTFLIFMFWLQWSGNRTAHFVLLTFACLLAEIKVERLVNFLLGHNCNTAQRQLYSCFLTEDILGEFLLLYTPLGGAVCKVTFSWLFWMKSPLLVQLLSINWRIEAPGAWTRCFIIPTSSAIYSPKWPGITALLRFCQLPISLRFTRAFPSFDRINAIISKVHVTDFTIK